MLICYERNSFTEKIWLISFKGGGWLKMDLRAAASGGQGATGRPFGMHAPRQPPSSGLLMATQGESKVRVNSPLPLATVRLCVKGKEIRAIGHE